MKRLGLGIVAILLLAVDLIVEAILSGSGVISIGSLVSGLGSLSVYFIISFAFVHIAMLSQDIIIKIIYSLLLTLGISIGLNYKELLKLI